MITVSTAEEALNEGTYTKFIGNWIFNWQYFFNVISDPCFFAVKYEPVLAVEF